MLSCFTIRVRYGNGSVTSIKKRKKKEKASFYLYFEMPRNSPEVGTLPSPCLCSRHSGSAQRLQVHQHRSVPLWFLGCLFLISHLCHFEPFYVASSEPLTCVCTHSFRPSDSLATRLLSSAQLLTFLTRFVDAAPTFTLSENSVVNGPSCLRYVYFTLLVLFVCLCVPGGRPGRVCRHPDDVAVGELMFPRPHQ